ncbi:glycosyl hydrolase-related protein [Parasutterella excrementihominis]
MGKEFSFVSSNNRNVIIKALKKAENSDEYVVRVYEIKKLDFLGFFAL